ncbi:MAG TPA: MerR family transcriptional regulator [Microbacteriaceae bacterium]|nr:MerR family transcriptional regulator [Microbacteriaceae bacterium]
MTTVSITELARTSGLSSRTLRHYETLGLIESTRERNGYRQFDDTAVLRLQRILVLRTLGLGLGQIREILEQPSSAASALDRHAQELRAERDRIDRILAALDRTSIALTIGEPLMSADPFDGFDHTQYEQEVTERWGADTYRASDRWWRGMSDAERAQWKASSAELTNDWVSAAESGEDPRGSVGQALAARHADWLRSIPGTPSGPNDLPDYLRGLGEMYVSDDRFGANYGGRQGAEFVRAALAAYADALAD